MILLAACGRCDTGDAAVSRKLQPASQRGRLAVSHVSCMQVGAAAWAVAGSEWGYWLSLTTGLHSTDSGGTRILGQVRPALQQGLM